MSEETFLKVGEGGFMLREKGGKKYNFNPPRGNLMVTNKRFIFAKSSAGLGKQMAVWIGAGMLIANGVWKKMGKVKPEDIDKALERSDSFALPLSDIIEAKAKGGIKGLTNSTLTLTYKNSENIASCTFIVIGGLLGSQPPNDWVESINAAKKGI